MHKCSEHRESFSWMGHPKRNALVHSNFQCLKCEKAFGLKGDLKNHMLVHTKEKNFQFSDCGKTFGRMDSLKTRMLLHTQDKNSEYSDCGKPLKSHMVVHTQEKKFQCSECGKAFGRKRELKIHMIIHTQEKNFLCSECGKTFGRMDSLKKHMLLHNFLCFECRKAMEHLKTDKFVHQQETFHYSKPVKAFGKNDYLKQCIVVHSPQEKFECKHCCKSFVQKSSLLYHMRNHCGSKHYKCFCGKSFKTNCSLQSHGRKHNREMLRCPNKGCDKKYLYKRCATLNIVVHFNCESYSHQRRTVRPLDLLISIFVSAFISLYCIGAFLN